MIKIIRVFLVFLLFSLIMYNVAIAIPQESIYDMGKLKPTNSELKVKVGDIAPEFTLPALSGGKVSLSEYIVRRM